MGPPGRCWGLPGRSSLGPTCEAPETALEGVKTLLRRWKGCGWTSKSFRLPWKSFRDLKRFRAMKSISGSHEKLFSRPRTGFGPCGKSHNLSLGEFNPGRPPNASGETFRTAWKIRACPSGEDPDQGKGAREESGEGYASARRDLVPARGLPNFAALAQPSRRTREPKPDRRTGHPAAESKGSYAHHKEAANAPPKSAASRPDESLPGAAFPR